MFVLYKLFIGNNKYMHILLIKSNNLNLKKIFLI